MSGICSAHRGHDEACNMCNTDIRELIPNYDALLAEAEKAGKVTCTYCDFVYYLTVDECPHCFNGRRAVHGKVSC